MVKIFLWKTCNNILLTKENLFKRGIALNPLCPICGSETETLGHILWSYSSTRDVWTKCNKNIHKCSSDDDGSLNIFDKLMGRLGEEEMQMVAIVARQI